MLDQSSIRDRFTGCLLGGALGDALGWTVEFQDIGEIKDAYGKYGILSPEPNQDGLYEITDDTQMTLFTAEGCLQAWTAARHLGPPPNFQEALYASYQRWLHTQGEGGMAQGGWLLQQEALHARRAPGCSCIESLKSGLRGTTRNPVNNSKGCGGVMRVAPVGLLTARIVDGTDDDCARMAFELGCIAASITHGHPTGYLSAGFLSALIALLVYGAELEEAISKSLLLLEAQKGSDETSHAIRQAISMAQDRSIQPSPAAIENLGEGWIAEEALAIGLYCSLVSRHDLVSALRLAVNHSGDSDSTGSITGNILGALQGEQRLPDVWLQKLELCGVIRQMGEDLFTAFEGSQQWLNRYHS